MAASPRAAAGVPAQTGTAVAWPPTIPSSGPTAAPSLAPLHALHAALQRVSAPLERALQPGEGSSGWLGQMESLARCVVALEASVPRWRKLLHADALARREAEAAAAEVHCSDAPLTAVDD